MQTLDKKSREIRRLIDKGMTTKQIKKIMQVKKSELYKILKSEYSERFSKVLFDKLKLNDYFDASKIVVDTSALEVEGIVEYLWKYHKILLHIDVIREMDEHKSEMNKVFGVNIRELLKRSAEDYNSLKVKVITPKRVSLYTDENLIHYLKKKVKKDKNIVLITADHALASLAKGYGIKYILARSIKKEINKIVISKEKEVNIAVEDESSSNNDGKVDSEVCTDTEESKNEIDTKKNVSLQFVKFVGKTLFLCPPIGKEDSFIVLAGGEIKRAVARDIPLKSGDKILQLLYTPKRMLRVQTFKIVDTLREKCAKDLGTRFITSVDEIEKLTYSDSVKSKIRYFFSLNRKP